MGSVRNKDAKMKKILIILLFLIMPTNVFGEVQFLNVGGPRIARALELKTFQKNESDVEIIEVSVTHDVNGKFYTYIITPVLKDSHYIKEACIQFWCDPINLQFYKKSVISEDGKAINLEYGIDENLKEKMRIRNKGHILFVLSQ